MADDPWVLKVEQAEEMLPEGEEIHTYRWYGWILLGLKCERAEVLDEIRQASRLERGGPVATSMGHGLVVWTGEHPALVETPREGTQRGTDRWLACGKCGSMDRVRHAPGCPHRKGGD